MGFWGKPGSAVYNVRALPRYITSPAPEGGSGLYFDLQLNGFNGLYPLLGQSWRKFFATHMVCSLICCRRDIRSFVA